WLGGSRAIPLRAGVDPGANRFDLFGGERLAGRHLQIPNVRDNLVEQTLFRMAGHDRRTAFAASGDALDLAHVESGRLGLAVAIEAALFQNGAGGVTGRRSEERRVGK